MIFLSNAAWQDLKAERQRWRDDLTRCHDLLDTANRELGALRMQNVDLQRENGILAQQMNLVIVQLAVANDERTALLRARGVNVNDAPLMEVQRREPTTAVPQPAWAGQPLVDDPSVSDEELMARVEKGALANIFDDPGDAIAKTLGRVHNEFGEVEHLTGR